MKTLVIVIIFFIFAMTVISCSETPELVFDNPVDPGNTSAPLSAPTGLQAFYINDSVFRVVWSESNYSTEGFIVERRRNDQSLYTVIFHRSKEGYEAIPAGSAWIYYSAYDSTVKRSDTGYRYRVRAYNHRGKNPINSAYSSEFEIVYP